MPVVLNSAQRAQRAAIERSRAQLEAMKAALPEKKQSPAPLKAVAGADDFLLKPFDREILTRVFAKDSKTAA